MISNIGYNAVPLLRSAPVTIRRGPGQDLALKPIDSVENGQPAFLSRLDAQAEVRAEFGVGLAAESRGKRLLFGGAQMKYRRVQLWDGTCMGGRKPTEDDDPVTPRCMSGYIAPGIRLDGATMYSAADLLSLPMSRNRLGRVVQDRTGLTGRYKMELECKFPLPGGQAASADISQPSLVTAIREQWGLKLEPTQGPFKVFAIESAHPPTEN